MPEFLHHLLLRPSMETKTRSRTTSDPQRSPQDRTWTVAYYAFASRIVIWAIAMASHAFIQDYDSALELILPIDTAPQRLFKGVLGVFLRWDSFYFVHQAENGYVFEQAHAFFPLMPWLMRIVAGTGTAKRTLAIFLRLDILPAPTRSLLP